MSDFLDSLAVSSEPKACVESLQARQTVSPRQQGRFVRGPIPAEWVEKAAKLPGKALHAAIAIRYLDGFEGSGQVKLRPSVRNSYGMDRFSCARALKELEEAGLVRVRRKPGSAPSITIIELIGNASQAVQ